MTGRRLHIAGLLLAVCGLVVLGQPGPAGPTPSPKAAATGASAFGFDHCPPDCSHEGVRRPWPELPRPGGPYEQVAHLIHRDEFAKMDPVHRRMLATVALRAAHGVRSPSLCFHPQTPQAKVKAFRAAAIGDPDGPRLFQIGDRWSATLTNPGPIALGAPITLRWSIVPDGTKINTTNPFGVGEPAANSNLKARLNSIYTNEATWRPLFDQMFARWAAVTGITYVYEPNDDGAELPTTGGAVGVRGEIRIGGHSIDGGSGILAYNYFPDNGDMVIDTDDMLAGEFFTVTTGNSLRLRNVLSHEHGHGLGLDHVCPVNTTKLMEPFVTTAFDGPQHDDILGAQRSYGDRFGNNNTSGSAAALGFLSTGTSFVRDVSINSTTETDFYSFSVSAGTQVTATLRPIGSTYNQGAQLPNGNCTAGSSFNSLALRNLDLQLRDTDGTSVLATANSAAAGSNEVISSILLPTSGSYFLRVNSADGFDQVQLYELEIAVVSPPGVRVWTGAGADSQWATAANWAGGIVPSAGDTLEFPGGAARLSNNNNLPADTAFVEVRFTGPSGGYGLSGNSITLSSGVTAYNTSGVNTAGMALRLGAAQAFSCPNAGGTTVFGAVNTNGFALTCTGAGNQTVGGVVSGTGGLVKSGAGRLLLNGANTYSGGTSVSAGTVGGTGVIGGLTTTGGTLAPGASPGNFSTGNVGLNASTTFSVELNGITAGTQYDRLSASGSVSLGNATLSVTTGFSPTIGTAFTIVSNDGGDPVVGTFNGIAEGNFFSVSGTTFQISYAGGDGNDVVLTVIPLPGPVVAFDVEAAEGGIIGTQTAGAAFNIRVTARDASDNVALGFTGTVNLTSNATLTGAPVVSAPFVNGVLTSQSVTITSAQSGTTITATRTSGGAQTGVSNAFVVNAAGVNHFVVEGFGGGDITTKTAGAAFNIRITARDQFNNVAASFAGTVNITSNAALVGSPITSAAFTAGVLASQAVTISSAQSGTTLTATRTSGGAQTGVSNGFLVNAAALDHFNVEAQGGGAVGTQAAGAPFNVRITARDQFENLVSGFVGTVNISCNADLVGEPVASGGFTAGVLAAQSLTITSAQTGTLLSVADSAGPGTGMSNAFTVTDGGVDYFVVDAVGGGPIPSQLVGVAFNLRIRAFDAFDNPAETFAGTAVLTSVGNLGGEPLTTPSFVLGELASISVVFNTAQNGVTVVATRSGGAQTGASNAFNVVAPYRPDGDFNADGFADLLWRHKKLGANRLWFMNGANLAGEADLPLAGQVAVKSWPLLSVCDLDGDDDPDLLFLNKAVLGVTAVFMNDEVPGATSQIGAFLGKAPVLAGCCDVDGDGDDDLIWRNAKTAATEIWIMQAGAVASTLTLPARDSSWELFACCDIDDDGDADLFWRNSKLGLYELWLGNPADPANPTVVVMDVAGLGELGLPLVSKKWVQVGCQAGQLLWHDRKSARVIRWVYNGAGDFTEEYFMNDAGAAPFAVPSGFTVVGACDLDRDEDLDLILRNPKTSQLIFVLSNAGAQTTLTRGAAELGPAAAAMVADKNFEIAFPSVRKKK